MLRLEMKDEIFFKCLRQFAEEYEDSWATFVDFVSVCNRVSNRDWMPFFHQWCYEGGYPAYRIIMLASKKTEEGWMTEVTIKNEGSAILRCPLELLGKDKKEMRFFSIPPGEEQTLSYSLPFKVDEAVIDPEDSIYQADEKIDCLKIPEGLRTPEEEEAIAEFKIIRKKIQEGQSFNDRSTPLHSYLSFLSCLRFKDREALKQIHPLPLSSQDDLYLSDWEERLNKLDVLRAPNPPQNPSEGEFWAVYVKLLSSSGLYDVHFFLFWDGEWKRVGNLGRPMTNWRPIAERMKPQILALLKK